MASMKTDCLRPGPEDPVHLAYVQGKRDGAKEALERVVTALRASVFADGLVAVVAATRLEDLLEKSLAPRRAGKKRR